MNGMHDLPPPPIESSHTQPLLQSKDEKKTSSVSNRFLEAFTGLKEAFTNLNPWKARNASLMKNGSFSDLGKSDGSFLDDDDSVGEYGEFVGQEKGSFSIHENMRPIYPNGIVQENDTNVETSAQKTSDVGIPILEVKGANIQKPTVTVESVVDRHDKHLGPKYREQLPTSPFESIGQGDKTRFVPKGVAVPNLEEEKSGKAKATRKETAQVVYDRSKPELTQGINHLATIKLDERLGEGAELKALTVNNGKVEEGRITNASVLLGASKSPEAKKLLDVFIITKPGEPPLIRCGRIDTEQKRTELKAILKEHVFDKGYKTCVIRQLNSPKQDRARKPEVDANAPTKDMVENEQYHMTLLQRELQQDKGYEDCRVVHLNLPRNNISLVKGIGRHLGSFFGRIAAWAVGENSAQRRNLPAMANYAELTHNKVKDLLKNEKSLDHETKRLIFQNDEKMQSMQTTKTALQDAAIGYYEAKKKLGTRQQLVNVRATLKSELQDHYHNMMKVEHSLFDLENKLRGELIDTKDPALAERVRNVKYARETLMHQRHILAGQLGIQQAKFDPDKMSAILSTNLLGQKIGKEDEIGASRLDRSFLMLVQDKTGKDLNKKFVDINKEIEKESKAKKTNSKKMAKLLSARQEKIQEMKKHIEKITPENSVLQELDHMWRENDFLYEVFTSPKASKLQEMMAFEQLDQRLGLAQVEHCKTGVDRTAGDWAYSFAQKEMVQQEWQLYQTRHPEKIPKDPQELKALEMQVKAQTLSALSNVAVHHDEDARLMNILMQEQGIGFKAWWLNSAKTDSRVSVRDYERLDLHLRMRTAYTSAYVGSVGLTQVCTGVVGNKGSNNLNPNHQPYKLLLPFVTEEGLEGQEGKVKQLVELDAEGKGLGPTPFGKEVIHLFATMRGS